MALHTIGQVVYYSFRMPKYTGFSRRFLSFVSRNTPPTIQTFTERVENTDFCLRQRSYQFSQPGHRQACPLGNHSPALNAMVHCNLLLFPHGLYLFQGKLCRVFNKSVHLEPEIHKIAGGQRLSFLRSRYLAIKPEERGYTLFRRPDAWFQEGKEQVMYNLKNILCKVL